MFRPLPFFVGLRYMQAKRRNHFISFISLISMIGLTLGICVLIIVMSVMNGFDRELKQRILGMVPHATITSASGGMNDWEAVLKKVSKQPGIVAAAPFIDGQGMLTSGSQVRGAMVYCIDPIYEETVSIVNDHMVQGNLHNLQSGTFGIIFGELMAKFLGVSMGDKITMILPETNMSLAGVFPRLKRFTVVGIFSVGAEIDGTLSYINIKDGARFMRVPEGVEGIRLQMENLFAAPKLALDIAIQLPGLYHVHDWTHTHGQLFQAIQMEKNMVGLLLTLIVAVAAFNIVSTLVMVVTNKKSDIAILRTLGANPRTIMGIFIIQGSLIGIIGTFMGVFFGILAALHVSDIISSLELFLGMRFLNIDVYFISYLPSELQWHDVAWIIIAGLAMSFLATLYPAWRASQTQPAEVLRYD